MVNKYKMDRELTAIMSIFDNYKILKGLRFCKKMASFRSLYHLLL